MICHYGCSNPDPRCKSAALPGSDYCEAHLDAADACVVRFCYHQQTQFCLPHLKQFRASGLPLVRWLASLPTQTRPENNR